MNYNVNVRGFTGTVSILDIGIEELEVITNGYLNGKKDITLGGIKYAWTKIYQIQIFENYTAGNDKQIIDYAKRNNLCYNDPFGIHIDNVILEKIGKNVTKDFLGNKEFGENQKYHKELKGYNTVNDSFIAIERIENLKKLKCEYDLSKLIRLCEELNSNYATGNYYSVAMLGRAIIDHIPPIFGAKNYNEVANNYASKSTRGSLNHLNESMRNISDGILHQQIRKKENLPTKNLVNFSQDFDLLLGEIEIVIN